VTLTHPYDLHSYDRPRPSSVSAYSYSTTHTLQNEHSRQYASPSNPGPSAEAALLAAKLRLSRSTSFKGTRNDSSSFDKRPGAASGQRSSFYGPATSDSSNGAQDFARPVQKDDVFAPSFTRVIQAGEGGDDSSQGDDDDEAGNTFASSSATARSRSRSESSGRRGKRQDEPTLVRYVLPYGLSGPAIEKNALNEALLAPAFEGGASESNLGSARTGPALRKTSAAAAIAASAAAAHAAASAHSPHHLMYPPGSVPGQSLSPEGYPMNDWMFNGGMAPASAMLLAGPNAVPLHLVHGLTSTSSADFPLDAAELATYETGLPLFPGAELAGNGAHGYSGLEDEMNGMSGYLQSPQHMVDPRTLRAIALTSQAAAAYRSHTVTRRFRDPFRESLERVARQSGRLPSESGSDGLRSGIVSPSGTTSGRHSPAQGLSGRASPHPRRGARTAPGSPSSAIVAHSSMTDLGGLGIGASHLGSGVGRPGLYRANTGDYPSMRMSGRSSSSSGGAAALFTGLVEAAEHPVRNLKRALSGGLSRGVFGMTRADQDGPPNGSQHGGSQGRQGRTSLR